MITIAFTDDKSTGDPILSDDWDAMVSDQLERSPVTSGAGAPSSVPAQIGAIYIDNTNNKIYVAIGTSSSSDFKKVLST